MLKGTLDDFTLPDIFRLMSLSKKTGSLQVERSAGQGKVYFRDGEVYYAESSLSKEPLGQKLVKAKALTEGQLRKALDLHAGSGKRLGEVLLEAGAVTEDDIMMVVRQQIEDAAFDLLRWELGEFLWEPGVAASPEVTIYVTVENLIMEASRRLDELEVIQRKIPSTDTVLAMAATPPEGAVEINITPEEWRILVLVNGVRTVREIGEMVGLDDFSAMRTLYGLVSAGLAEVPGHAESGAAESGVDYTSEQAAEAPEPEAVPEPVAESRPQPVAESRPQPEPAPAPAPEEEPAEEPLPEPLQEAQPEPVEAQPEPIVAEAAPEPVAEEVQPDPVVAEAAPEPVPEEPVAAAEPEPFVDEEPVQPVGEVLEMDPNAEAEAFFGLDEPVLAEEAPAAPEVQEEETQPEPVLQAVPDMPTFEEPDLPVEAFDAPEPGDLVAEGPASNGYEDPLASEILSPAAAPPAPEEPVAPPAPEPVAEQPEAPAPEIPVSSESAGESPRVDRMAAVRELAGLFSEGGDDAPPSRTRRAVAPEGDAEADNRKRVEDDEQVTRGLISRLIDGVKGL